MTNDRFISINRVGSREEADALKARLTEMAGSCYMGFTFTAAPDGGEFQIGCSWKSDDTKAEASEMLIGIMAFGLIA